MAGKLIFVSCGQATSEEKELGVAIKLAIDATTGYQAYFAEAVQNLEGLTRHIFDAIRRCAGAVIVLHQRGQVTGPDGSPWGVRSSVWINQEVGLLAYRQYFEEANIPVLAFVDPLVKLEGAMTSLIVNPLPLRSPADTLTQVQAWLKSDAPFVAPVADGIFEEKWLQLSAVHQQVVGALVDLGGSEVKEHSVRQRLQFLGMEKNASSKAVADAKLAFVVTDLVKCISNIYSGDEMTLNPTWAWHLRRQVAQR